MKNKYLVGALAGLSMTATQAMGLACPDGFTETTVSGSVTTMTVSPTQQFGNIELTLTHNQKKRKVKFEGRGDLVGTITGAEVDEYERPVTIISHSITFDDGSTMETVGDRATFLYPLDQCTVAVEEVLSNFYGTGVFKRATGEIRAEGQVGICPPPGNENSFTLSGTACLFKGRQ